MRIRQIHIDGFGRFSEVDYGPLERPVTVFFGPNEAGKSTLLQFVRRVLFGFPRRSARVNSYPALAGGSYGGHITFEDSSGHPYDVRRTSGRSYSGEVTLTSGSGNPLPETELTRLLGNHSQDVFEQVFAFTLDELYSDDLLNDANVNGQIYSAGMGVTSLQEVTNMLNRSRNDLFRSGGSTQEIYAAANSLDTVDAKLQKVADNVTLYRELTTHRQQVEVNLEGLAEQRRRIQSRYDRQATLNNAWDAWNDYESPQRELTSLSSIDNFPADGVNRLEALEERIRTALKEHEAAGLRVTGAERTAKMRVEHEVILKHTSEIRHMQKRRTAFDGSVKDLPEREAELDGHKKTLAGTLKDLGPDWNEVRLEEFDLSIAVRQEITRHGNQLREASAEHLSRKSELVQVTTALEEAIEAESKARLDFEATAKPNHNAEHLQERRTLTRTASAQLGAVDRTRQNLSNLQNQLKGVVGSGDDVADRRGVPKGRAPFIVFAAFVLIAVVIAVTAFSLAETGPMESIVLAGLLVGLALIGVAAFRLISSRMSGNDHSRSNLIASIRHQVGQAEQEVSALESQLNETVGHLGIEEITERVLISAEGSLDAEASKLAEWDSLSRTLREASGHTKQRKDRKVQSQEAVEQASDHLNARNSEWQQWLTERGLLFTFTPETADALQRQVELGRSRLGDVRSWQQRIRAIEKDIDDYIYEVEPLATEFDITFNRNDPRTVALAADRLLEILEGVQESVGKRDVAEAELKEAELQLQRRKSVLEKAKEELGQLLQSGGTQDAEDFRVRAGLFERRGSLEEKVRNAHDRLQRLSGPGEALEKLKAELTNTDPQSIADEITALEEERAATDVQLKELSTERGSIQNDLERLVSEEESSRLRMERNVLVEQIRGNARDWARHTLAQQLLNEARRKFERERQPGVVRHAEKFFTEITEGRYQQVYAPLGEKTITVTDADGRTKQPSELSRGTREQLFLSLRFGLIRELVQRTEPLPVVVDEILVNFDPDRALRAAVAFTELSSTNQVLVFTCHPTVVELFRNAASEAGTDEPDLVTFS